MAQETPFRFDNASTFVARETSFAALPTMLRASPVSGSVAIETTQAELDVTEESVYLYNEQDPVKGLKEGTVALDYYLKPPTTQLVTAATPDSTALGALLKAAFGAEVSAAGSQISASGSGTAATVASGAVFNVGGWALGPLSGSLLPVRVSAISTNDLTFDLGAGAGMTTSTDLVNMHNWYPLESSTETLYVQHAIAGSSSNHKWAAKGCIVESLELETARNKLLVAKFKLKAADWEYPTDDSVAVTVGNDGMGSPFSMRDAVFILQTTGTATRTAYEMLDFKVKLNLGMRFQEDLGGATEGKVSAYRDGQRMFAEATIKTASADVVPFSTWYTSRTALQCVIMVPQGSSTTKRWCVIDIPNCIVVGVPKTTKEAGMAVTEFTVRSKMRSTSASAAQGRTPFALAIG
jgi:hypothetical protein